MTQSFNVSHLFGSASQCSKLKPLVFFATGKNQKQFFHLGSENSHNIVRLNKVGCLTPSIYLISQSAFPIQNLDQYQIYSQAVELKPANP